MRKKQTEKQVYKGFFTLPDGRNSKVLDNTSYIDDFKILEPLINFKYHLKVYAVKAMRVSGSKWAEIFIINKWDYIEDHFVINKHGRRLKFGENFVYPERVDPPEDGVDFNREIVDFELRCMIGSMPKFEYEIKKKKHKN